MKLNLLEYKDHKAYLVGFAVLVTFIFVLVLSFVNELTKEQVKKTKSSF